MAVVTYKVVRGDTLAKIAAKFGTTATYLATLNKISNPNLIYIGQVLTISGATSGGGSSSTTPPVNSNVVTVTAFGQQADTDRTIFAVWTWSKTNTKHYEVWWWYKTSDNRWFEGTKTTTEVTHNLYNAPSNAVMVEVRIKPVSNTYTSNNKEVSYWTADWTANDKYQYSLDELQPTVPATPTVTIEDYTLTSKIDNLNVNAPQIEFEIVKNDASIFKMGIADIITSSASFACSVNAGDKYKVRARAKRGSQYSDWSQYSSNVVTKPIRPETITTCSATSKTSVLLEWTEVITADTYDIEYTTKKEYFDDSNATTKISSIKTLRYEITGLGSGERYFFRVRAVNSQGESDWTPIVNVVIGTKPSAPTSWTNTTTVKVGEDLVFYWLHNSEDKSKEVQGEIEVYVDSTKFIYTVQNPNPDEDNKTSSYVLKTNSMTEGSVIKWRVRTSGITGEYGDWSTQRTVNVYAPPTLNVELLDKNQNRFTTLTSFPFYIKSTTGPVTQTPISYHISMISNDSYETIDEVGNTKTIIKGEEVYSKFQSIINGLTAKIMPGDVDLQNGINYSVIVTIAMNSGLTSTMTVDFTVSWIDEIFAPDAQITIDKDTLVAHIRPYCDYYPDIYYQVNFTGGQYIKTNTKLNKFSGVTVDNILTTTGEIVYNGVYNGTSTFFCIIPSESPTKVPDISLSVYRREYDGRFVEIGTGLKNTDNTFITDPHPSLDFARYRIVAISNDTGSISFNDIPAVEVGESAVVIQWDEEWSNFYPEENRVDSMNTWAGSMLKLLYNIDISESNSNDVTLVNYIGRKHPVSYYGTHVGTTANWSVEIPKYDKQTIYMLRRLAIWLGDVYVREPSGSGYWANISTSFGQKYNELTIPITFSITRVVGGM